MCLFLFAQALAACCSVLLSSPPSCGGAVDGYLQKCTTFVWTPQGTDAARAQPLPLFCSKKKTTTSSTDHPDTVPVPRPKHTPRPTSRRVHRWSGFPSPPRAPPLGHRRTTPSQPPRPSHHPPEPPPPMEARRHELPHCLCRGPPLSHHQFNAPISLHYP